MKRKAETELVRPPHDRDSEPYAKKVGRQVNTSALFRPAKTIGVVTERIPFAHTKLGTANFITVSVGRGFEVYETEHLRKAYLGPVLNAPIRALLCVGEVTITALKNEIVCWHKIEEVVRLVGHEQKVSLMANLGSTYLISASDRNECYVWKFPKLRRNTNIADEPLEPMGKLDIEGVSCMAHPPTYLNKMLIATQDGRLGLWNVKTCSMIHEYGCLGSGVGITSLEPAPTALDMVAVGFQNGRLVLLNAKTDAIVCEFKATSAISCLSF